MNEMRMLARACLLQASVDAKLKQVRKLTVMWKTGKLELDTRAKAASDIQPGRPDKPTLARASKVKKRGFATQEGRAVMMHAIAHIEFNAINLALDAVQRFADMPEQFYSDWLRVAEEEVYHFELIRAHMRHMGADYGDYPAHGGLWEMCEKTAHDVLIRMALVPRVLEARGLDVTPGIQEKLSQAGDENAVSLLDIILRDEIGHVEIGNRWFRYCCDQRGVEPVATFTALLGEYYPKGLMGPYNMVAREKAGFSKQELSYLCKDQSV
ncbi:ferritin-like domain-containing protein [Mariprofundus micogutta]|nr:ferritin-like domain-containing protein [Mariprofundus micogutta]